MTKSSPPKPSLIAPFSNHDLRSADHAEFRLIVTAEATKEDLLNPRNYRDIIRSFPKNYFKAGSIIEIMPRNFTFYARFLVAGVSTDELFLRELDYKIFKKSTRREGEAAEFDVSWDEKSKYFITRKADKKIIKSGFSCEEEALSYLKNIY